METETEFSRLLHKVRRFWFGVEIFLVLSNFIRKPSMGAAQSVVVRVVGRMTHHLAHHARKATDRVYQVFEIVAVLFSNHKLFSEAVSRRLSDKDRKGDHSTVYNSQSRVIGNRKIYIVERFETKAG